MLISNPLYKKIIHETVSQEEALDLNGKPTPRTSFPKKIFRDCRSILKKIEHDFDVDITKDDALQTIKLKDYVREEHGEAKGQRYSSDELEFTKEEIAVFVQFYNERKEVPSLLMSMNDKDLEDFLSIVENKIVKE